MYTSVSFDIFNHITTSTIKILNIFTTLKPFSVPRCRSKPLLPPRPLTTTDLSRPCRRAFSGIVYRWGPTAHSLWARSPLI